MSTHYTPAWTLDAACRESDPDLMFPPPGNNHWLQNARDICRSCPVAIECLTEAMQFERGGKTMRHGIHAGTTPHQRAELAKDIKDGQPLDEAVKATVARVLRTRSLNDGVAESTIAIDSGHILWIGGAQLRVGPKAYAPRVAVFLVGHGRRPEGHIRNACDFADCVAWEHLTDSVIRKVTAVQPAVDLPAAA